MIDLLTVKKAPANEIEAKQTDEEILPTPPAISVTERQFDRAKVERFAVEKFVSTNNLHAFNLISNAKLSSQFSGVDPITDVTPIFDAYINTNDAEIFVEARPAQNTTLTFRDRLYVMLTKIHHYKVLKKVNVYLVLVLVDISESSITRPRDFYRDKLQREFEPAINSGLLRIQVLTPGEEELDALRRINE